MTPRSAVSGLLLSHFLDIVPLIQNAANVQPTCDKNLGAYPQSRLWARGTVRKETTYFDQDNCFDIVPEQFQVVSTSISGIG